MSKRLFQKTSQYSKHNTKGCWLFPSGEIVPNRTFDDKELKTAFNLQMMSFGAEFFHSIHEAEVYLKRLQMEKLGLISELEKQYKLSLHVNGVEVFSFKIDFSYIKDGKRVIEDAKGSDFQCTPDWIIKWKWAQALYPDYEFLITYSESHLKSISRKQSEKRLLLLSRKQSRERDKKQLKSLKA